MPWRSTMEPTTVERVVGGLSYLTFGVAGLLYILFSKDRNQSEMFRFHFYQAIILSVVSTLVQMGVQPLAGILVSLLSLISGGLAQGVGMIIATALQIVSFAFFLLLLYGAIMAFLGRFAEVPVFSRLVRQNMR